jgi:hypothetical protein
MTATLEDLRFISPLDIAVSYSESPDLSTVGAIFLPSLFYVSTNSRLGCFRFAGLFASLEDSFINCNDSLSDL